MNEKDIQRLADLLFDKIMEKQEQADQEYHEQIQRLVSNGYQISSVQAEKHRDELGLNQEEKLVGELARLQTIMMIFEDKEEYEKAAIILKKIDKINLKLNNGSGKY
jgi:ribulose bisphosphate carboxylase small subunit